MNSELRVALSCVTQPNVVVEVMEILENAFAKFPRFKSDPDAQVLLWLELVSVFAQHRGTSWGVNFKIQRLLYQYVYQHRDKAVGPPIVWRPSVRDINNSNVCVDSLASLSFVDYQDYAAVGLQQLHQLSQLLCAKEGTVLESHY